MRIYKKQNVFEAALDRIRFLYNEFDTIVVSFSGGKDSTVIYNLAKIVAEEKNRFPVDVMFLDQEAEWENTIKYVREVMYDDNVNPHWYQIPFGMTIATSFEEEWFWSWNPEKKDVWMRDKEDIAIKENTYGHDKHFKDMFLPICEKDFPGKTVLLVGMRTEESPGRLLSMMHNTYKGITWGKKYSQRKPCMQFGFYPIYDWSYTDVWKSIHENGWPYNHIYDIQFQHGLCPRNDMRVSSLIHEVSVKNLFYMQKIEPETYEKLTTRTPGVSSTSKFEEEDFFIKELPFMFNGWKEYRDYLIEKLIKEEHQERIRTKIGRLDEELEELYGDRLYKRQVKAVLSNDFVGVKLDNIRVNFSNKKIRARRKEKEANKKQNAKT